MTIKAGFAAVLVVLLQACDKNQSAYMPGGEATKVSFTSIIDDGTQSRVVDSQWETGDSIGLFMIGSQNQEVMARNIPYYTPNADGLFTEKAQPVYYPEDGAAVDFIAFYPFNRSYDDYTAIPFSTADQSRQEALDFMVADNLTGRTATSPQGNLQFRHKMAKLKVNLTVADGNAPTQLQVAVKGLKTQATLNLDETENASFITLKGEAADVTMKVNDAKNMAEAILIPQTIDGKLILLLEVNGKSREVTTDIAGQLEGGMRYTVNLTLKNLGGSTEVDPEAPSYTKWLETPVITQSEMNNKNLAYRTRYMTVNKGNVRNFSYLYSKDLKFAYWVAYPLFTGCIGNHKRTDPWRYDDMVDQSWQVDISDAAGGFGNGYDRGHQIPSGDRTGDKEMNEDTFYSTNATAQVSTMNQQIWRELEEQVRSWMSGTDTLYIVTGAMPPKDSNSYKYAKGAVVPDYYFKALARRIAGKMYTIAFSIPNSASVSWDEFMNYKLTVGELEKKTGFTFFPQVSADIKNSDNSAYWKK